MPRDEYGVPAHIPPDLSTSIQHSYYVPPEYFPFLKKLGDDDPSVKPFTDKCIKGGSFVENGIFNLGACCPKFGCCLLFVCCVVVWLQDRAVQFWEIDVACPQKFLRCWIGICHVRFTMMLNRNFYRRVKRYSVKHVLSELSPGELTFAEYEEMFYKSAKPLKIYRNRIPMPYRTEEEVAKSPEVDWEGNWLSFQQRVRSEYLTRYAFRDFMLAVMLGRLVAALDCWWSRADSRGYVISCTGN